MRKTLRLVFVENITDSQGLGDTTGHTSAGGVHDDLSIGQAFALHENPKKLILGAKMQQRQSYQLGSDLIKTIFMYKKGTVCFLCGLQDFFKNQTATFLSLHYSSGLRREYKKGTHRTRRVIILKPR